MAAVERSIGLIYRPDTERWSHYGEAVLPRPFDAWVRFDETKAATPLRAGAAARHWAEDETYPFGL